MIFRNDDISYETDLRQFEQVQALFDKYNTRQTIAVICNNIGKNKPLINFINKSNIDVQLHCWNHYDLTANLRVTEPDLQRSIDAMQKYFNVNPAILYPPWNKSNSQLEELAAKYGLTVSNKKISLSKYIKCRGKVDERVINFHSWCLDECVILETALRINAGVI